MTTLEKSSVLSLKGKHTSVIQPRIPLLGIYTKEIETDVDTKTHS